MNFVSATLDIGGEGFERTIELTHETQASLAKAKTALQSFTETDPVYTADKPTLALKSEIPDVVEHLSAMNTVDIVGDIDDDEPSDERIPTEKAIVEYIKKILR